MFDVFQKWSEKIESSIPIFHGGVKQADYYARQILSHLRAIEELLADSDSVDAKPVKLLNLVNGTPQTFTMSNSEDFRVQAIVLNTPSALTTVTLSVGGINRYAKNTQVADTSYPKGSIILPAGSEVTATSTGGDIVIALLCEVMRPRSKRAVIGGREPKEVLKGGERPIGPQDGFADEATHIAPTDPEHLTIPGVEGLEIPVPFPPYDG